MPIEGCVGPLRRVVHLGGAPLLHHSTMVISPTRPLNLLLGIKGLTGEYRLENQNFRNRIWLPCFENLEKTGTDRILQRFS